MIMRIAELPANEAARIDALHSLRILDTPQPLDLIISDVVMPGMSGLDFARRARLARPGMPIVLVTGDSDAMESVLESGAIALLKPYSPDTLRQVVGESLEARGA